MNNKLLLQDLTDQLAEAGKIKKKEAEEFLRAFFKVSEEALFEDGIIKINGLGTLKLVLVDARKSVNVSTGEEFEIREHYKVSFIPDADLKNTVNQPYSHLEPVELDGGAQNNAAAPVEKKTVSVKEKTTNNVTGNKKNTKPKKAKRSTLAWILFFLLIVILGVWSWRSNDQRRKEDVVKIHEMELIDSLEADVSLQEDLAAITKESGADSVGTSAADDSLEAAIQSVAQETGTLEPASTVVKPTVTSAKQTVPTTKTATPTVKQAPNRAKQTVAPIKQTTPAVKPTAPATKTAAPVAKPTAVKTPVTTAKPAATAVKTTTAKPATTAVKTTTTAVKTVTPTDPTEYIATVKLAPGERLTLLALKYYGDKVFWVYIYEANKNVIPNPDKIPSGITVRIPKPDPKIIDAKNEALIAKAKALQLKYIGAQ